MTAEMVERVRQRLVADGTRVTPAVVNVSTRAREFQRDFTPNAFGRSGNDSALPFQFLRYFWSWFCHADILFEDPCGG